ncbi:hypothetical protein MCHI_000995 [Candidatus Magnetoovum chiemensis]|nr:hypothetical protein MCHI_000995 [Candidatus Magnetoovum chiemensis]
MLHTRVRSWHRAMNFQSKFKPKALMLPCLTLALIRWSLLHNSFSRFKPLSAETANLWNLQYCQSPRFRLAKQSM